MDSDGYDIMVAEREKMVALFLADKSCSMRTVNGLKNGLARYLDGTGYWQFFCFIFGLLIKLYMKVETPRQYQVAKGIEEEFLPPVFEASEGMAGDLARFAAEARGRLGIKAESG